MTATNEIPRSGYCQKAAKVQGKFIHLNGERFNQLDKCLLIHRKPMEFFDTLERYEQKKEPEGIYTLSDKPGWTRGICSNPVLYNEYLQTNI